MRSWLLTPPAVYYTINLFYNPFLHYWHIIRPLPSILKPTNLFHNFYRFLFSDIHGGPTFDPVGRCSHVTLMHEKTLLIQRIKSVFFKSESQSKVFSSKSQSKLFSKSESGSKTFFRRVDNGSNVFFRRVVIFSERNLSGSKAFSHASASRDYMSLPTLTGSKVIPPCT